VDSQIINKIHHLVAEGVRNTREMQRHISVFVKDQLFQGGAVPNSRRYIPKIIDLRNHIYKASIKLKFSKLDQENLCCKVQEWKKDYPDDQFFFRGYGEKVTQDDNVADNVDDDEDENDIISHEEEIKVSTIFLYKITIRNQSIFE